MGSPPSTGAMNDAMCILLENMGVNQPSPTGMVRTRLRHPGPEEQAPFFSHTGELETAHAIETALKKCTSFAHELAAELRRQTNRAALIHHLPTEILASILLETTGGYDHLKNLMQLRLVCQHWAQLTLGYPLFWRVLDSRNPMLANVTSVSRAGYASLDIWLWNTNYFYEPFMSLVLPLLERVQSVHYKGELPSLVQTLVAHAEEDDIEDVKEETSDTTFELPSAFNLRSLSITNLRLDWGNITLSNLTQLTLMRITHVPPNPLDLVKIIASSPLLRALTLGSISHLPGQSSDVESPHPEEPSGSGPKRICIDCLENISLWSLPKSLVEEVIRSLRFAEDCTYWIMGVDMKATLDIICNGIRERFHASRLISISVTFCTMWTMDPGHMKFSLEAGQQISIELHPKDWEATFKALSECFNASQDNSPLSLSLSKDRFELHRGRQFGFIEDPLQVPLPLVCLEGWRNIQEIHILERVDPRPILGVLGQKLREDAHVQAQPCAVLKSLLIEDWEPEYLANFNSFLRRRWGTVGMASNVTMRPTTLEAWDARWNSVTFEELRKTVHEAFLAEHPNEDVEHDQVVDLGSLFGVEW